MNLSVTSSQSVSRAAYGEAGIDVPYFAQADVSLENLESFAEDADTDMVAYEWNDAMQHVRDGVEYLEGLGQSDPTEPLRYEIDEASDAAYDGVLTIGEFARVRQTAADLRRIVQEYI